MVERILFGRDDIDQLCAAYDLLLHAVDVPDEEYDGDTIRECREDLKALLARMGFYDE